MHSGFGALRSACPMNIEASLPAVGAIALRDRPGVRANLDRLTQMWQELLPLLPASTRLNLRSHGRRA